MKYKKGTPPCQYYQRDNNCLGKQGGDNSCGGILVGFAEDVGSEVVCLNSATREALYLYSSNQWDAPLFPVMDSHLANG
jgi:hypothetical protein